MMEELAKADPGMTPECSGNRTAAEPARPTDTAHAGGFSRCISVLLSPFDKSCGLRI